MFIKTIILFFILIYILTESRYKLILEISWSDDETYLQKSNVVEVGWTKNFSVPPLYIS